MSPARKSVDTDLMIDLLAEGLPLNAVAPFFNCSIATIQNRIEQLRSEKSMLLAYDKSHYLDLISVKQRLIAHMTDEKMDAAPLSHLAQSYGIIGKMEQLVQGRPTEIHGLMGYLMHLEKEDIESLATSKNDHDEPIDITPGQQLDLFDRL